MTLHINLGNLNVIMFVALVAAVVAVAAVRSTPSLLHSVALYCLVRRDALLAHRHMMANLKEEWLLKVPYPEEGDTAPESQIGRQPVAAVHR